jgi:hypothetical protein
VRVRASRPARAWRGRGSAGCYRCAVNQRVAMNRGARAGLELKRNRKAEPPQRWRRILSLRRERHGKIGGTVSERPCTKKRNVERPHAKCEENSRRENNKTKTPPYAISSRARAP